MDSYVLAETFKYLYLLYASEEDLCFDVDSYVFTTEAHMLPLSLGRSFEKFDLGDIDPNQSNKEIFEFDLADRTCPNARESFRGELSHFVQRVRKKVGVLVPGVKPKYPSSRQRKLRAMDFNASNKKHLHLLKLMGIQVIVMPDGRVQLEHHAQRAASSEYAEEGSIFMHEMIELSKQPLAATKQPVRTVQVMSAPYFGTLMFPAFPAQFGSEIEDDLVGTIADIIVASPYRGCGNLLNGNKIRGKIALVERSDCMFIEKARNVQNAGGVGIIIVDHVVDTSANESMIFAMSGDGQNDVTIPAMFLFSKEGRALKSLLLSSGGLKVRMGEETLAPSK